ncbi:MAG: aspartate carbamoyltransferase regulatory subunit [Bacteroidales bacterium]|jgi:aspartate carbamoyltransferase regulatory subunit|nr:aspartate carbamoyltransferase regulatory subunit [Bacteroidales bacterium]
MGKKELIVSAIENGTVIDHIASDKLFQVIKILNLDVCSNQILFGTNLRSSKLGVKAIIKIQGKFFERNEINKIAIVSPSATLIKIKDYDVVEKVNLTLPDQLEGIVKCYNPKCITNHQEITPKFKVLDSQSIKLQCHYCQKITKQETLNFI